MNHNSNSLLRVARAMLAVLIVAAACSLLSGSVRIVSKRDYERIGRYRRLDEVRELLLDGHYQETSEEELIQGALKGMAASMGDEYTVYYTAEEMEENDIDLNGQYSGVGLLLQRNEAGKVEVIRVYEHSPAEDAGVLSGDILLEIDGEPVNHIDAAAFENLSRQMRGESGTTLSLRVQRGEEQIRFALTRGEISVSNVRWCMLEGDIGYIDIVQFGGNVVEGFREARAQLKDARALIIDVRNNPGGLLDDVVSIADEILDGGLIVYMETKDGTRQDFYAETGAWEVPLVVLTNEMSASASEILAAAVQDNGRGAVIGTTSYGKGIVQSLVSFESDGAGLQYTFAAYFTPSGRSIHKIGVTPDVIVENDTGDVFDTTNDPAQDVQLARAIAYLKQTDRNGNGE